jgi:hypothetical protein
MRGKITRRQWAAVLGAAAATAPARTQPPVSQTAAELAAEAGSEVRHDIELIGKFPLPASAEPAFVFKP